MLSGSPELSLRMLDAADKAVCHDRIQEIYEKVRQLGPRFESIFHELYVCFQANQYLAKVLNLVALNPCNMTEYIQFPSCCVDLLLMWSTREDQ